MEQIHTTPQLNLKDVTLSVTSRHRRVPVIWRRTFFAVWPQAKWICSGRDWNIGYLWVGRGTRLVSGAGNVLFLDLGGCHLPDYTHKIWSSYALRICTIYCPKLLFNNNNNKNHCGFCVETRVGVTGGATGGRRAKRKWSERKRGLKSEPQMNNWRGWGVLLT